MNPADLRWQSTSRDVLRYLHSITVKLNAARFKCSVDGSDKKSNVVAGQNKEAPVFCVLLSLVSDKEF